MAQQPYAALPKKWEDVLSGLTSIDPDHVDFSVVVARELFTNEQHRNAQIEQKATLLIGAASVAAAVLLAIAGFLMDFPETLPRWPQVVVVLLFAALAIAFFGTVVQSLRVLLVGIAHYPGALIVLEKQTVDAIQYKKAHIADLFAAFSNSLEKNNWKAGLLRSAQLYFGGFVCALLVTGLFMAAISLEFDQLNGAGSAVVQKEFHQTNLQMLLPYVAPVARPHSR